MVGVTSFAPRRRESFLLNYIYDEHLFPPHLQKLFITLDCDQETDDFFASVENLEIIEKLSIVCLKPLISCIYGLTETNAFLGIGQMFLLSSQHLDCLLGEKYHCESHLDIGSGDGSITEKFCKFARDQFCIEISRGMMITLQSKQFKVFSSIDNIQKEKFDLITILNVFDRCEKPISLLNDCVSRMHENTILMISIVLPFFQYVEKGEIQEKFIEEGLEWNNSVVQIVSLLEKHNLNVIYISRLPYLSQGDVYQDYYVLDTVIIVAKLK